MAFPPITPGTSQLNTAYIGIMNCLTVWTLEPRWIQAVSTIASHSPISLLGSPALWTQHFFGSSRFFELSDDVFGIWSPWIFCTDESVWSLLLLDVRHGYFVFSRRWRLGHAYTLRTWFSNTEVAQCNSETHHPADDQQECFLKLKRKELSWENWMRCLLCWVVFPQRLRILTLLANIVPGIVMKHHYIVNPWFLGMGTDFMYLGILWRKSRFTDIALNHHSPRRFSRSFFGSGHMIWFQSEMMECFPSQSDSYWDKGGGPPTLLSAYSH